MSARNSGPWRRLYELITFLNMPIRSKFILFSVGVSFWFVVIAGAGLFSVRSRTELILLLASVAAAHLMLVLFAMSITHSLTQPVDAMIEQIRILTKGGTNALGHIVVASGDEIGELSHRFNRLLDTLKGISNFRKVIEEDDSAQDVYERMSHVFRELELGEHQLYNVARGGNGMQLAVSTDESHPWCNPAILSDAALCRAKKTGLPVWSNVYPRICKQFALDGREHVCLPLLIGGSTNGVAQFVAAKDGTIDDDIRTRVEAAQRFIQEALPVLEAKHLTEALRESALRDPLTQLYNRRFLEETAQNVTALARRRGSSVGVIMCDLDHFKQVNDTYGHPAGDAVLRDLATILTKLLRTSDYVIRYGGEEFLVVLQDTEAGAPAVIAERIRATVEAHSFLAAGETLRKTISVGVAQFPEDGEDLRSCIKLADAALYEAKTGGRNRVVRYGPGIAVPDDHGGAKAGAGPAHGDASSRAA